MKPSNNKEWKKAFAAVKSLIKEYDIVTFGSAVYDEYINGNLELPERFVDMADQAGAPHTTPDLTDWGWGIFEAVKNGELVFSDDELNAIECYCENPSWMYNRKGKRIDEMGKRIQLNEAQLKRIIAESVKKALKESKKEEEAMDVYKELCQTIGVKNIDDIEVKPRFQMGKAYLIFNDEFSESGLDLKRFAKDFIRENDLNSDYIFDIKGFSNDHTLWVQVFRKDY